MRVLVTGGSGFLGSHIAEQLHRAGHDVRCLVRKTSKTDFLRALGVTLVDGSLDDRASLDRAVKDVDAVVHSAGVVKAKNEQEFREAHVGGTLALAEAAVANAPRITRFVHVSTAAVMGPSAPGAKLTTSDAPNPRTRYAKSKLEGERALLALSDRLPITVIRPPAIYGPRDAEILAFFKMVRRSRVAIRLGRSLEQVSMVYGADAADACVRAIDAAVPSGSIYFVDDGEAHSYGSMARAIADGYGVRLLATPSLPEPIVRAAAAVSDAFGQAFDRAVMFSTDKLGELLIEHFLLDSEPARRELGWAPRTGFAEGARLTAEWYREHGWD
jgi:nucleoside-diphosphate-sugar epimerase